MRKSLFLPLVSIFLVGCEGPRDIIYNMTPCTITVTYSAANIDKNMLRLPSGDKAGTVGVFSPQLREITIVDSEGIAHSYSASDLARLRQSGQTDLWAYYPDGLKFITNAPSGSVSASRHICPGETH